MSDKEKKQFAAMRALLNDACIEKFGKDFKTMAANPNFKRGLRHGNEKPDLDGYGPTCRFATASTKTQPGLMDRDRTPIMRSEDFYAGCWARATVTAYGYDNKSKGVAFGLQNLQKLGDDESFSGRVAAEDDFEKDEDDVWEKTDAAPASVDGDDFLDG
jgi:hypothetical protein